MQPGGTLGFEETIAFKWSTYLFFLKIFDRESLFMLRQMQQHWNFFFVPVLLTVLSLHPKDFASFLLQHTSVLPFPSLLVPLFLPCLRLSLPLFAFNSWGHPGPLGSHPRMLSRLMSCGVAFWTDGAGDQARRSTRVQTYNAHLGATKKGGILKGSWFSKARCCMEMR